MDEQDILGIFRDMGFNLEPVVAYISNDDADPIYTSPPKHPKITCYCCGKEPPNIIFNWRWGREYYEVSGQCCGKLFRDKIQYKDIREGRADTYVVNLC